jgi:hypothetical protein
MELAGRIRQFRSVVRDQDVKLTAAFGAVFASERIRVLRTPVRAPRANADAERWAGTIRREVLDRMLILGRRHLERALSGYMGHYNHHRPHRSLGQAPPVGAVPPATPLVNTGRTARLTRRADPRVCPGRMRRTSFRHPQVRADTSAYPEQACPTTAPYTGKGRRPRSRYHQRPSSLTELAVAAGQQACTDLVWRRGSRGPQRGRFLVLRVRPAGITRAARRPTRATPSCRCAGCWSSGPRAGHPGQVLAVQPARGHPDRGAGAAGQAAWAVGPAPVRCASVPRHGGSVERDDHALRPDRVLLAACCTTGFVFSG